MKDLPKTWVSSENRLKISDKKKNRNNIPFKKSSVTQGPLKNQLNMALLNSKN